MKRSRSLKRKKQTLLAAMCILFLILVLLSGWKVYSILHGYKTAERRYDSLAGTVVGEQADGAELNASGAAAPEEQPQPDAQPQERSPVTVDFEALRVYGGVVIGWINLPNTVINYPVAQAADNEYYLDRFLDGSHISGGTLFADFICPSDFSGKNTIIYGHNMKDGSMFALVDDYADQSFYEQHPVMYLNTPTQNYRVDIFSGFTTDPESFVYTTVFASAEDFAAFLTRLYAASEISCDVPLSADDRIITLSTCAYTGEDVRFVVCGKLTEIG